jgi:hypothetical protein
VVIVLMIVMWMWTATRCGGFGWQLPGSRCGGGWKLVQRERGFYGAVHSPLQPQATLKTCLPCQ